MGLAPPGCTCSLTVPRCQACIAQRVLWHGGTARDIGAQWAKRVSRLVGTGRDWPSWEDERCAAIARRLVAHLDQDEGLRDALARRCHEHAAWRWERIRASGGR